LQTTSEQVAEEITRDQTPAATAAAVQITTAPAEVEERVEAETTVVKLLALQEAQEPRGKMELYISTVSNADLSPQKMLRRREELSIEYKLREGG
jgi:hypothetical protein